MDRRELGYSRSKRIEIGRGRVGDRIEFFARIDAESVKMTRTTGWAVLTSIPF